MMLTYLLFPIGLVLLIKGADFLVNGASSIAKRLGVSSLVIGLTIVAFGTSAPELIVSIFASVRGNTDIAIGNILGSNIANILLILGVAAVVFPLSVKRGTTWKEIPFSLLAILVVGVMVNDARIDGGSFSGLTRIDGFVLIAFFIVFLYYTFGMRRVQTDSASEASPHHHAMPRALLMVVLGLVGLTVGGKWIVDAAVAVAKTLGVSEALIGLTIVAIGTSLPELATSAVAAYKKDVDIAVGNIVGSN
ncbi:MAG: calcium/sodium antiporter, partial [bacterium]|nr:calcium/sodium antiporter [bacterium]